MVARLDYVYRLFKDGVEALINSTKITYTAAKVTDDIGITASFIKVPLDTAYADYARTLRADALFTYMRDLSNLTSSGVDIKVNGGSVEFKLRPDLWLEKSITSIRAKNDSSSDRIILIIQAYPRTVSFY